MKCPSGRSGNYPKRRKRAHGVTRVKGCGWPYVLAQPESRSFVVKRMECLASIARLSVRGENVTVRACIDFAGALLAPNVPNARDGVAVLTLTKGSATTTVVEVSEGIDTLIIATNQARDGASRETLRARSNIAGAEFTLLGSDALVVVSAAITIAMTVMIVIATFTTLTTLSVLVIIAVFIGLSRGPGRSRGFGGGGTGWGWVATKGARAPIPASATLRRREGIRWLVRSTATLSRVPRPVEGAVGVGRWVGGIPRSPSGKTDVLGVPLELVVSTAITVGENEGNSQNQESNAGNERHFRR